VARIHQANGFGELVSDLGGEPADAYRRLVKIVHPDAVPASRIRTATQAFARLSALCAERDGRTMTTKRGTYRGLRAGGGRCRRESLRAVALSSSGPTAAEERISALAGVF
jgi:hypothetical protein